MACVAVFSSGELPGMDEPYSSLVVARFQDRFGDADAQVVQQIMQIEWDRHAVGWTW